MQPPVIHSILNLFIGQRLHWQIKAIDAPKSAGKERMPSGDERIEVGKFVCLGPGDCCIRHRSKDSKEDVEPEIDVPRNRGWNKCKDLLQRYFGHRRTQIM